MHHDLKYKVSFHDHLLSRNYSKSPTALAKTRFNDLINTFGKPKEYLKDPSDKNDH